MNQTMIQKNKPRPTRIERTCLDCGKTQLVIKAKVVAGGSKRCRTCATKRMSQDNITHGGTKTRLYRIWRNMLNRCENSNVPTYSYYGGRGIKVCDRWKKYELFKSDVLPTYADNLTLDRIDNNGNYEPGNFRWTTQSEQVKNRRHLRPYKNGVKGVSKHKNRWVVIIKRKYQGSYDTLEEAQDAATKLNKINEYEKPNEYER